MKIFRQDVSVNLRLQGRSRNILANPGRQTHLISDPISAHISDFDDLHSGVHWFAVGVRGAIGAPSTPPDNTLWISLPVGSCSSRDTSSPYSAST